MSFLDTLSDIGSTVVSGFTGSGILPTLARTAALGFVLNQVNNSVKADSAKTDTSQSQQTDTETRVQQSPDTTHSIPVVYGSAFLGGIVTDAVLTNSNQTMYFCMTICEKTGTLLSTNAASQFIFDEIYWDGAKVTFQADGITVASLTDDEGNTSTDYAGLIKIYCYAGSSATPVVPTGYSNGSLTAANGIMPNWSSNHTMNDLIFAIVRVDYQAEKDLRGLGTLGFKIRNSMTQPGDCMYDYMTNTRYGAGITPSEIYSS